MLGSSMHMPINTNPIIGTPTLPPPLPPDALYTSCYCEENIYLLAQTFRNQLQHEEEVFPWDIYVVFISNDNKTVALWRQKARKEIVVWDYHVILVLRPRLATCSSDNEDCPVNTAKHEAWIYDFDTRLAVPSSAGSYMADTFPYLFQTEFELNDQHESLFRVIEANVFLDHFASDRSHMILRKDVEGRIIYSSPPPTYPPICGPTAKMRGVVMNLFETFVSMKVPEVIRASDVGNKVGEVLDMHGFLAWLSCAQAA